MYVDSTSFSSDEELLVTEKHCFVSLINGIASPCPSCVVRYPWKMEYFTKVLSFLQMCLFIAMHVQLRPSKFFFCSAERACSENAAVLSLVP